jgi:hypothetical protein
MAVSCFQQTGAAGKAVLPMGTCHLELGCACQVRPCLEEQLPQYHSEFDDLARGAGLKQGLKYRRLMLQGMVEMKV